MTVKVMKHENQRVDHGIKSSDMDEKPMDPGVMTKDGRGCYQCGFRRVLYIPAAGLCEDCYNINMKRRFFEKFLYINCRPSDGKE